MEALLPNLFVDVVNMGITASYVILFVLVVRLLLKKAPKIFSYSLWSVVLFRLICPFSFYSALSFLKAVGGNPVKIEYIPSNIGMMAQPQINTGINGVDSAINASLPASTPYASANPIQIVLFILSMIWASVIIALLLYSIISYLILKRKIRTATLVVDNILECDGIASPFVFGIVKPKIYLPVGLNNTERSYILKHEQTHVRRFDYLIKPIAFLSLCVHWFNPLVWVSFMLMAKDMEMSCDERVLKKLGTDIKKDYSTSMLSLAVDQGLINASPLAFGESYVKARIKNVLNYRKPAFWVTIVAAIAVAGVGIGLMANPKDKNSYNVSNAHINYIQIEITVPGSQIITGKVITDKNGYKAGDIVSVAISETVSYNVDSLEIGDWIEAGYYTVREKYPPEFVAYGLSKISSDYPTTFTLVENGDNIKSNTLHNPRVSAEMPALILSGNPSGSPSINDAPGTSRYLKIDIGSGGDKIYYTYEMYGKCYIEKPYGTIYEISRETYDELMLYISKNEITEEDASIRTAIKPTTPVWSPDQIVGADMAVLDYASNDTVIFHGYFGLFVYDLNSLKLVRGLDLKPIDCDATQGDEYCEVSVSIDGNTVQLHPVNSKNMYVYTVSDNSLFETTYVPLDNAFGDLFIPIKEAVGVENGNYSYHAVQFRADEYGFLHTYDGTLGTLSYARSDMMYSLFQTEEQ